MAVLIDTNDPRGEKAVALAARALAAGWPSIRAYHVPSSSDPTRVYVTTRISCECADFRFRGQIRRCYHALAVELLDELANEKAAF